MSVRLIAILLCLLGIIVTYALWYLVDLYFRAKLRHMQSQEFERWLDSIVERYKKVKG